jgi:hypothetical protein
VWDVEQQMLLEDVENQKCWPKEYPGYDNPQDRWVCAAGVIH